MSVVPACLLRYPAAGAAQRHALWQPGNLDAARARQAAARAGGRSAVAGPAGGSAERFQVEALLGSGGMARVYRALDTWTQRNVALKAPIHGAAPRASLEREARLMTPLKHRYVLGCRGLVRCREERWLALEYCRGGSLAQRFRHAPVTVDFMLRVAAEACSALGFVHRLGLLHLDVKPHNLLLTAAGQVRLADFGSAVDRRSTTEWRGGDESAVVTPYYMAPEQWALGPVDERTDLWALGVVLHEGCFGVASVPPGLGVPETFTARVQAFRRDGACVEFARLLAKALAPDPCARFQSAIELLDALRHYRALREARRVCQREPRIDTGS